MIVPSPSRLPAILALIVAAGCVAPRAASIVPAAEADDVAAARDLLAREREAVLAGNGAGSLADRASRMIELGLWSEAESLIAAGGDAMRLPAAELRFRQHRFLDARRLVDDLLLAETDNRSALLLRARLQIQGWALREAISTAEELLRRDRRDEEAALLIGRVRLLQKRYDEAAGWAERVQEWDPLNAGGHLLEADVLYWREDPAAAERSVVRALRLDPLDPDARFSFGYAIWRRVDATQLEAMAAQWDLALDLHPLHHPTHWHRGNGHTHLTYADYAQPEDSTVRVRLAPADSLISAGRTGEAVDLSRRVQREFPRSVLPTLLRGSAFYMAWEMDREARLDSAQAAFREILERKPNFGPAHNGLAAVIKQRQFTILAAYDSLEAVIAATPLPRDPTFESVFPDIGYYPGDRVARMVRLELGPSYGYLPLIEREGRVYRIPPLHHDLAQAMGRSYFRTATTFDNRQWMDIRGVGSGAAGIEYVERGAHQERNVLLHEFVHLFHGIVFTDAERRRVRELYHRAMAEGRTLDYYAANNESEFLAQAYPAYFSAVRVHPLNHKSMNTVDDLRMRDPETYAWIDSLVARQRRYLQGDSTALASNWSQVYVNLAESARRDGSGATALAEASALLDTAMVWDGAYLPAMLSRAALLRNAGRFAEAGSWLDRAISIDSGYAPTFAARAELVAARERAGEIPPGAAIDDQARLYRRAIALEDDLAGRASLNRELRELYAAHGRLAEAVAVAEEYVAAAPTISTYLRDRRDEAAAYAAELRSRAGYAAESLALLRRLVARKPQNYSHRLQLAEALMHAGALDEAGSVLEEAQRILRAGGGASPDFAARIAEVRLLQGDTAGARQSLTDVVAVAEDPDEGPGLRAARALLAVGRTSDAQRVLEEHPAPRTPAGAAELAYTRGYFVERRGDDRRAARLYAEAIAADPYHARARLSLLRIQVAAGNAAQADELVTSAYALELPPGPDLETAMEHAMDHDPHS